MVQILQDIFVMIIMFIYYVLMIELNTATVGNRNRLRFFSFTYDVKKCIIFFAS